MSKNETKQASMIKGLAAVVTLAALGLAGHAFATEANPTGGYIKLENSSMMTGYTAYVGAGTTSAGAVNAYSNGVTFSYQNATSGGVTSGAVYTLYGFCIDVTHDMTLGGLNLLYSDTYGVNYPGNNDPVPDSFLHNGVTFATAGAKLNALIDTGWLLHESEAGKSSSYISNVDMQLAAIQAAIWSVEGNYVSINSGGSTAYANVGGAIAGTAVETYADYFTAYSTGAFKNLGDSNDKFYTILDTVKDTVGSPGHPATEAHQGFAVGWPIANVPEPATWAMMIMGFIGTGVALRSRRKLATAAI